MKVRVGGDLGDSIFSLSIIRQIPDGPHDVFFVDQEGRCTKDFTKRTHLLIPLFEKQPYIKSAKNCKAPADIDFTEFRNFHGSTVTIPQAQAIHLGVKTGIIIDDHGVTPWLTVKSPLKSRSGIIIARSERYNNDLMPWKRIVEHYGWRRLTFVGLPDEHVRFCSAFGAVQYQPVKHFYELAQLIHASALFIGNQSSPMSLAIGMGHPFIEECDKNQPDCVFNRTNAQYVCDGACTLPDIDGSGVLEIAAPDQDVSHFSRNMVPPGYWQYPGLPPSSDFNSQKILVAQLDKCHSDEADLKLMLQNVKRVPHFFADRGHAPLETFKTAYQKAFGKKELQTQQQ